jgi:hypothetical protein
MVFRDRNAESLTLTARRISEGKRSGVGIRMLALDAAKVPPFLRPLLQHAEILGVGDDGTRGEIFGAVPHEYLELAKEVIRGCPGLFDWYRAAEKTDAKHSPEVAAIGWMLLGLNLG